MTNLVICLMSVVTNFTPVKAYVYYDVNKPALWEFNGKLQWNFHEETFYRPSIITNFTYVSDRIVPDISNIPVNELDKIILNCAGELTRRGWATPIVGPDEWKTCSSWINRGARVTSAITENKTDLDVKLEGMTPEQLAKRK